MKAKIERDWMSQMVKVWLYTDGGPDVHVLGADGAMHPHRADVADLPEPTFRLPEEGLAAVVREASNILPVTDATSAHLADAIGVRERLLVLVEARRAA